MKPSDIPVISRAFCSLGWHKPESLYERYFAEQTSGRRVVFVAETSAQFAGYGTLLWEADYPCFQQSQIPVIADLNVMPASRNKGVGTALIVAAEKEASARRFQTIGIGVGLERGYGAAQRLYVRLGFVPDGRGMTSHGRYPERGEQIPVDDALVLWFTKAI